MGTGSWRSESMARRSCESASRPRRRPLERTEQILAAAQVGTRPHEAVDGRLVAEDAGELRALKGRIEALDLRVGAAFRLEVVHPPTLEPAMASCLNYLGTTPRGSHLAPCDVFFMQ